MALSDNIISYWNLDEASGTAADAVGGNTLANANAATFISGLINNCVHFVKTSAQYLYNSSPTGLDLTGSFTISLWFKPNSVIASGAIWGLVCKERSAGGEGEYDILYWNSSGTKKISLIIRDNSGNIDNLLLNADLGSGSWKHLVWTHDYATHNNNFFVDNSKNVLGGNYNIGTNNDMFAIGSGAVAESFFADADFDEVGIWSRVLSDAEIAELFNSGAGLQYPFTPPVDPPTVTTQAVSDITTTTATGNGNVTDDGGAEITERGVCWGTSTNPTTADDKATAAGTTGAFTADITGLTAGTHYHVRAYAINSEGTSYGVDVEFDTETTPPWRFENLNGLEFDHDDKKTIYAERLNEILDRLHALDGLEPDPEL